MSNRTPSSSDTSPSILERVRSRVSGWFSPTSPGNTNGNLRRRRESDTEIPEEANEAPPVKKLKSYIVGPNQGIDSCQSFRKSHHSSTPTTSTFGTRRNFLDYSSPRPDPYNFIMSSPLHRRSLLPATQEELDEVDETPISEIQPKKSLLESKIPEEEDDAEEESIPNGDSASESGASMSSASVNLRNLPANTPTGLRQSSTINFGSHLQSKKSLFSDKNISMSMSSLNSLSQKRSFNASLYGSTSALSDSRLLNIQSPFYRGRTMFGGASAYSTNNPARNRKFPSTRPSSSLPNFSSSSTSQMGGVTQSSTPAGDEVPLSKTAKRIMEVMNQLSGPLSDVRKMAHSSLTTRQRFSEQDMAANRTVRLQTPKTPYTKTPTNPARMPPMSQLQVPSMSRLLRLKKLQSQTEQLRKCALETTTSSLNRVTEYKLPSNTGDSESGSKHINKMRNKITRVHQEVRSSANDEVPAEVELPDVQLPQLKSVPKFDITFPMSSGQKQQAQEIVKKNGPVHEKPVSLAFTFSQPTLVATKVNFVNSGSAENFTFSEPIDVTRKLNQFTPQLVKKTTSTVPVPQQPALKVGSSVLEALKSSSTLKKLEEVKTAAEPVKPQSPVISPLKSHIDLSAGKKPDTPPKVDPPKDKGFMALTQAQSNKWECSGCFVRNNPSAQKCPCCGALNPTAPKVETVAKKDFSELIAKQKEKWECSACATLNEPGKKRCVCCEQAKPGEASEKVPSFNFSATPKFTFGMPPVSTAAAAEVTKTDTMTTSKGFIFGSSPAPAPSTITTNESDKTAKEPAKGGFIFGNTSSSPSVSSTAATVATSEPSKFVFGVPKTVSATSANESSPAKFVFGASTTASTTVTSTVTPAVTSSSSLGGFKFGVPPVAASTAESSVTPKVPAPTFSFGASPATVSKASEPPSTTSSSSSSTTIVAGTTTASALDSKPIPSIFGARTPSTTLSSSPNKNLFSAPAASSFGSQTPSSAESSQILFKSPMFGDTAAKTPAPAAAATPGVTEPKKTLDFGASSQPFTFGAVTTTTTATATSQAPQKPPLFTFGSTLAAASSPVAQEPAKPQQSIIFGGVKPQEEKAPAPTGFQGFGGFGAPQQQQPQSQPTFGTFGAAPAATPSPFGQVNSTAAAPAPAAFGGSSTFGAATPSTNLFGGSQAAQPSVFGASTTSQPPAAGGNIFGGLASKPAAVASPFGAVTTTTRGFDASDGIEPSSKKQGFDFGAPKPLEANSPFTFGANNNNPNPAEIKPAFNFSAGAAPNFNFTGSAQQPNSAQPFSFTGSSAPSFNFEAGLTDSGTNAPAFQFGGTNPFAATPSAAGQQPRRKIRPAIRRIQR